MIANSSLDQTSVNNLLSTIINDKIEFDGTDIVNVSLLEIQNIGESFKVFVTVTSLPVL